MQLICWDCQNFTYFEADVETMKELKINPDGALVEDAMFQDWNYSESMLRENLSDIVSYVLKQDAGALRMDHDTGEFVNNYLSCARCGSKRITKPYTTWTNHHRTLEEELRENNDEYSELRREKRYGHHLPVLWTE